MSEKNFSARLTGFYSEAAAVGYVVPDDGEIYRSLRDAAAAARFPAKLIGQIWCYDPADVHVIARARGLKRAPAAGKRQSADRSAA